MNYLYSRFNNKIVVKPCIFAKNSEFTYSRCNFFLL